MKRFIIRSSLFFCVFVIIIVIGFIIPDRTGFQNLHYSIYDKHSSLNEIKGKRLLLVGGSNLSFSLYSPLIEDAFNISVINTSIQASYGLKFMLDDVYEYINEGDVVLVSPEYFHFYDNNFYGSEALIQLFDANYRVANKFSLMQWYLNLGNICKVSFSKYKTMVLSLVRKNKDNNLIYRRDSYNRNGDNIAHWGMSGEVFKEAKKKKGVFNKDALKYLLKFNDKINKKGAHLFVTFPCLTFTGYENRKDAIREVEENLRSTNLELVGDSRRYCFPDSLNFNGSYHLIKDGQMSRTKRLINDLKEVNFDEFYN